jgi:hypothetical protein
VNDFLTLFEALHEAQVRYLVVGGVAVVLHGHPRFTADVDLVVKLTSENCRKAVSALGKLGYRPRAPVPAEQFESPELRRQWAEEKGLITLSFWSPQHPATEVDVFVNEPFDFDAAYAEATMAALGPVTVPVASVRELIALKQMAGRPKDLEDIRHLRLLQRFKENP